MRRVLEWRVCELRTQLSTYRVAHYLVRATVSRSWFMVFFSILAWKHE